MVRHSTARTPSLAASLLLMPVFLVLSALSNDLDARAAEPGGDTVRLTYAWKPNLKIDVETRRGRIRRHFLPEPHRTSIGIRYLLSTAARDENLHVTFSDLATIQDNLANGERPFVEAALQFAGLIPDFLVSPKGEFLRVENASAVSSQLKQFISSAVPSLEDSPGLAQALERVSSEQFLEASSAKQWDGIVGFWIGEDLEIGVTYEAEGTAPHPLVPNVPIAMKLTYGATRRVPCGTESEVPKCIELFWTSEVGGDQIQKLARDLADRLGDESERQKIESLQFTMIKEEIRLVTEPDTLVPHYFEFRKTIEGRGGPNDADRDGRIDYQESIFRYR